MNLALIFPRWCNRICNGLTITLGKANRFVCRDSYAILCLRVLVIFFMSCRFDQLPVNLLSFISCLVVENLQPIFFTSGNLVPICLCSSYFHGHCEYSLLFNFFWRAEVWSVQVVNSTATQSCVWYCSSQHQQNLLLCVCKNIFQNTITPFMPNIFCKQWKGLVQPYF